MKNFNKIMIKSVELQLNIEKYLTLIIFYFYFLNIIYLKYYQIKNELLI